MKKLVNLTVNGEPREVSIPPYETLLQTLREDLFLIGAKQGCDTGGCGCCTVLVDGESRYSCMTYTATVENRDITTIEGLAEGSELDAVQQAFVDTGAVQCGYCTCGMIMAAKQLLSTNSKPSDEEIRKGLSGNLCRCTGYHKIVEAVKVASGQKEVNS